MQEATICFLISEDKVCLGLKKRGFGVNKYNGFGGKVGDKEEFKDETVEESIRREGLEEFGIEINNLESRGQLMFIFPQNPGWGQLVHIFISTDWKNDPSESEEMKPVWFKQSEIPFSQMWDDDKYWLPSVIEGKAVSGHFEFDKEGIVVNHELKTDLQKSSSKERK